jgi:fatty-acid desaturase
MALRFQKRYVLYWFLILIVSIPLSVYFSAFVPFFIWLGGIIFLIILYCYSNIQRGLYGKTNTG